MALLRWIVVAFVFIALVYLSLQNSERATLTFFNVAKWEAPLVVVVFVAFACGVAAGLLAGALRAARLKRQLNKLRRDPRGDGERLPLPAGASPGTAPASARGPRRDDRLTDGL